MVESSSKLDTNLLDLDNINIESIDSKPSFEGMILLVEGIQEKITQNNNFDINMVLQMKQLQKNMTSIEHVISSESTNQVDEDLCVQLMSKRENEDKLNVIMAEYENQIAKLVRDNVNIKKERETLEIYLANMEATFSDVHKKYEYCKNIIEDFKNNEELLKAAIQANKDSILKLQTKFDTLKMHTTGQLDKANNELNEMKAKYDDEALRLSATIKRLELKNSSLKSSMEQRNKEYEEMSRIFDEIISKVGH